MELEYYKVKAGKNQRQLSLQWKRIDGCGSVDGEDLANRDLKSAGSW